MATLPDLSKLSHADLVALVASMASKPANRPSMKVSEKGCLSIYGLNTRGIHLYASQIERLLAMKPEIEAFISANPQKLAADGTRLSGLARKAS